MLEDLDPPHSSSKVTHETIDLTAEHDERKQELPRLARPKSPQLFNSGMKCLDELIINGHSTVNGQMLVPGDQVTLEVIENVTDIKRARSSCASLLIRSSTGARIGRFEADIATKLAYLINRRYFHVNVTCLQSPGALRTFSPLLVSCILSLAIVSTIHESNGCSLPRKCTLGLRLSRVATQKMCTSF